MLDKISIISSKIKRNCLSIIIASVIISIIFGKSIAKEAEFLLVIDMLAFDIIFFCLCADSIINLINNIKTYDSISSWLKHTIKNIICFLFPGITSMVKDFYSAMNKLINSKEPLERYAGIILSIVLIYICIVFVFTIINEYIPLFRGDAL